MIFLSKKENETVQHVKIFNLQTKGYAKTYVRSLCVFMVFFPRIYFVSAKSNPQEFLKIRLPTKLNLL